MTRRWKLAIGICVALCTAGVVAGTCVLRLKQRRLVQAANVVRGRAEKGDAKAQRDLGSRYFYGQGVPQDYTEAALWYHKAAEQGNPKSQFSLASMYFYGKGVPQDYTEAAR